MRGADGPVESAVENSQLGSGNPPRRIRPQKDWFERTEPLLADYLDEPIRTAARQKQQAHQDALATRDFQPRDRDRHRQSEFILKGILVSKQGEYPMTGRRTGKKGHQIRYYAVGRAFAAPTADRVLRRMIRAEPLERAVVAALQEILRDSDYVRRAVVDIARRELEDQTRGDTDLQALMDERKTVERKLSFIVDEMDDLGRAAVKQKVRGLQTRLREIDEQVRRAGARREPGAAPEQVAARVCERLASLAAQLPELPPAALRNILKLFVPCMVVDLQTKQVDVEFALPNWSDVDLDAVCLDDSLACRTDIQAHTAPLRIVTLCPAQREYVPCKPCRRAA